MIMMGRKELLAVAHESANLMLRKHGRNARERGWVDALDFWLRASQQPQLRLWKPFCRVPPKTQ